MNCVLLGYGTIGKGVEDLVKKTDGLEMTNVFVLPEFVDEPYFTNDGLALVTDPKTDIVFECLSGTEPANELITAALESGKHVITSNKAVVSENLDRYIELADRSGGSLQIEASVAGGIPFLDEVLKLSRLEDLSGYEGIFNGTGNYILDLMQKENADAADALKQAQEKGYAEFDPSKDIEGYDAWYKAIISNALAYKTYEPGLGKPLGITKIDSGDVDFARKEGKVIRHIVTSMQDENGFDTIVAPVFLNSDHFLANIPLNYNAQLVFAPSFEQIGFFGQGAGRYPTAQALLQNALDTLGNDERRIVLNQEKQLVRDLKKENWIVRSEKDLSALEGFDRLSDDGKYAFFQNRGGSLAEEVQALDPDAMIALWRE